MIEIKIDTDGFDRIKQFMAGMNNQLAFATSVALNQTARDIQQALKAQTRVSFNSPTTYTINAFRYNKSTKQSLVAEIYADPSRKYFPTEIFGGTRRIKKYEPFLRGLSQGKLPQGKLVPTRAALNQAGNPSKSLFAQIKDGLSTTDPGGFFIGKPTGGDRPPGVYRRSRGKLHAYFVLVDHEPRYRPLFPMEKVGSQVMAKVFPSYLSAAIDKAMATAK